MYVLPRRVFYCTLFWMVFSFFTNPISWAQEPSSGAWCNLYQLDFSLGPKGQSIDSKAHWLVVDIRNRSESACKVVPHDPSYRDGSASAKAFEEQSQELAPGSEAHVLIAWSSIPYAEDGIVIDDCRLQDEMSPYAGVTLRNLQMWVCGGSWSSSYRVGTYHPGEPVSEEWLKRVALPGSAFVGSAHETDGGLEAAGDRAIDLWVPWGVQYLKGAPFSGYSGIFILFLTSSAPILPNCPFRTLRKRETDGQTIIYLNHCEEHQTGDTSSQRMRNVELPTWVFGISPEKTGTVEYEAAIEVVQDGKPKLAKSSFKLFVRDPNTPMLPSAIDTNAPPCKISQLSLTSPPVELGTHWDRATSYPSVPENWYDAKVFGFTNASDRSCVLGGAPELKFANAPWVTSGSLIPEVCRNCATPVFKPRESRWIELEPQQSAHFIVARLASYLGSSSWCNVTGGIQLSLPGESQSMQLPFEASFCGAIPVSAWRSGKYDGDPMNLEYDRAEHNREQTSLGKFPSTSSKVVCIDNSKPKSQLPPPGLRCEEEEFLKRGKPAMSPVHGGIAFGVSSPPGNPKAVDVWMDNQTDKQQSYYVCCRSTFLDDIDVYDAGGQRLIGNEEQAERKICAEGGEVDLVCSCSAVIMVAPHTVQVVDSGVLTDGYVLSPGRYFVTPARVNRRSCDSLKRTAAKADGRGPSDAVVVVIPEQ
jgi:hypothetical protein